MKKTTLYSIMLISAMLVQAVKLSAQWTNGQYASYVVGQTNFSSNNWGVTDSTFSNFSVVQGGPAIDAPHHAMYITDLFAHRVLRFAYPVTSNNPKANLVFGQPDFISSAANNGGVSATSLYYPGSCTVDTITGTLWIADNGNHRILRFDNAYTLASNMPAANEVVGQPNFTSNTPICTSSTIKINNGPITGDLAYYDHHNDVLWVVDNGNYRVLRFDAPQILGNGPSANAVLGQANFTDSASGSGQNGFFRPDGVTSIGNDLYITDAGGNRVMRFDNVMSVANGGNATVVLGQSTFATNTSATSQTGLSTPSGLASDASGELYIADLYNNRIMIFKNANSLANGANADFVLLQTLFTTSAAGAGQNGGGLCATLAIDNEYGNLVGLDRTNNRFLVFPGCGWINTQPPLVDTVCSLSSASISVYTTAGVTYQWQENQGSGFNSLSNVGIYSGVTTNTLHISPVSLSMNGYTYRCIVTGSCVVDTTTTTLLSVQVCTGVNNIQASSGITVYPNPSTGVFNLSGTDSKLGMNSRVEIYNTLGEKIYSGGFNVLNSTYSIDISSQPSGVYFMRIMSSSGESLLQQSVIKQ